MPARGTSTLPGAVVGLKRASVSLQPCDLRAGGWLTPTGWAKCLGDVRPPKPPCFHASEPTTVRVLHRGHLHRGHLHRGCHRAPWHRFGPTQVTSPRKALGMVQGTAPSRWTRPPHFGELQGSAEGSSRREASLQIQRRHLQGSASMSPSLLERSLKMLSASSGLSHDSLPSHPCGWLITQACPHPYRDTLPSTSNLQLGELRHQTFGVVVYRLFFPLFCSLSERPRAVSLSRAPQQGVLWSMGQRFGGSASPSRPDTYPHCSSPLAAACQIIARPRLPMLPWGCRTTGQPLLVLTHGCDLGCRAQVGDTGSCKLALRSMEVG